MSWEWKHVESFSSISFTCGFCGKLVGPDKSCVARDSAGTLPPIEEQA